MLGIKGMPKDKNELAVDVFDMKPYLVVSGIIVNMAMVYTGYRIVRGIVKRVR